MYAYLGTCPVVAELLKTKLERQDITCSHKRKTKGPCWALVRPLKGSPTTVQEAGRLEEWSLLCQEARWEGDEVLNAPLHLDAERGSSYLCKNRGVRLGEGWRPVPGLDPRSGALPSRAQPGALKAIVWGENWSLLYGNLESGAP